LSFLYGKSVRVGDHIPYVICTGDAESFADRAYHPDQVMRADGDLKVDVLWYLSQQIHPPISRLCEPIAGTDAAQIADCLGLDPTRFRHSVRATNDGDGDFFAPMSQLDDEEKFKNVEKFHVTCRHCTKPQLIEKQNVAQRFCRQCNKPLATAYLKNQIELFCRKFIRKYYEGWLLCDDISCPNNAQHTRHFFFKNDKIKCTVPDCKGLLVPEVCH
jgi:DNA polymerase alpha subunit A